MGRCDEAWLNTHSQFSFQSPSTEVYTRLFTMSVIHVNTLSPNTPLGLNFSPPQQGAPGCRNRYIARKDNGDHLVIQVDFNSPGASFPPLFAFQPPQFCPSDVTTNTKDGKGKKREAADVLTLSIDDPIVAQQLSILNENIIQELAASRKPNEPPPRHSPNWHNPLLTPGKEKTDGSNTTWAPLLKLKVESKYKCADDVVNADFPIVDLRNEPVDPYTLNGRRCMRFLFHVKLCYSTTNASGMSCKLVMMTVTDNRKNTRYEYIECPPPVMASTGSDYADTAPCPHPESTSPLSSPTHTSPSPSPSPPHLSRPRPEDNNVSPVSKKLRSN